MKTHLLKSNGSDYIDSQRIYHSFNRTNNKEELFKAEQDFQVFLDVIDHFLSPFVDFIAHNLLQNHFHFMYQVKPIASIVEYLESLSASKLKIIPEAFLASEKSIFDVDKLVCNQFRRACISYTKGINKGHKRKGNLFYKNIKTKLIKSELSEKITLRYINCNTIKHNLDVLPQDYEWSSYNSVERNGKKLINAKLAMKYFSNYSEFKEFHLEYIRLHAEYLLHKDQFKKAESNVFPEHLIA